MAKNTIIVSVLADTKKLNAGLKESGGVLQSIVGTGKIVAGVGLAIAGTLGGIAAAGGFKRALNMDEARTQLKALGYDVKQQASIMDSALKSVKGTAFSLDQAATIAANALASGIPEGERLTKALTTVSNTAALAKTDLGDMGAIFQKVWANGKVTTEEMNQLADRGVPIWQYLSQAFGVSNEELRKMISNGEVTADMFENALSPAVDGMATKMSESFRGMLANARASLSRLGALFAGPVIQPMKDALGEFTIFTDAVTEKLKPIADMLGNQLSKIQIKGLASRLMDGFGSGLADGAERAIMSAIQSMTDWLAGGGLARLFTTLAGMRDGFLNAMLQALPGLTDAIIQAGPGIINGLLTLITGLLTFIVQSAGPILSAAVTMFSGILQALTTILPDVINQLVVLIPQLINTLLLALPQLLDAAVQLFTALIDALPIILPNLVAGIVALIPVLVVTLIELIPLLMDAGIKLFLALAEALPQITPNIIAKLNELAPVIMQQVIGMMPGLLGAAKRLFWTIIEAIPTVLGSISPEMGRIGNQLVAAAYRIAPQLYQAGSDLVAGLARGLWNNAGAVVGNLLSIARNAIGAFKRFFGINSPSRLMAEMGVFLDQGLGKGISSGLDHVRTAMDDLNGTVTTEFNPQLTVNGSIDQGTALAASRVYEITVHAVTSGVETGRAIVEAIQNYERVTGGVLA